MSIYNIPAKALPRTIPFPTATYTPKPVVPARQGATDALKLPSKGQPC